MPFAEIMQTAISYEWADGWGLLAGKCLLVIVRGDNTRIGRLACRLRGRQQSGVIRPTSSHGGSSMSERRSPCMSERMSERMSKRCIATLGALVFSMLTAAASATSPSASIQTEGKLLVFGDSLSAGYGLKAGEEWPTLLQQRLAAQGSKITVINSETAMGDSGTWRQ